MAYGIYYQADVVKKEAYMVTSTLRFSEHVAFDRCVDVENSIFEFFIAPGLEDEFVHIMKALQTAGYITAFTRLDNRLEQGQEL